MAKSTHITSEKADKSAEKKPSAPISEHSTRQQDVSPLQNLQRGILPASLRPAHILQLQRSVGNRAVGALLKGVGASRSVVQAKLANGIPIHQHNKKAENQPLEPDLKPNKIGLPDHLKSGIEALTGISMDNVSVHYNSPKPRQINALAYAQGSDIHVAPGQEQHLPHEVWHVVQQAQGRVRPTMQMKEGVPVNSDQALEHEADVMGTKALQMRRPVNTVSGVRAEAGMTVPRTGKTGEASQVQGEPVGAKCGKVRLNSLAVVQCFRNWKDLYKTGWKYSGGTMATYNKLGGLWHASVYRVERNGKSHPDGLFYNGFHLTMEGQAPLPHVFFDDQGQYQAQATNSHPQTKAYRESVGEKVLANDIAAARELSAQVLPLLGLQIENDQRVAMEEAEAQKKADKRDAEAEQLRLDAAQFAENQAMAAAQPEDEGLSLEWLLKDAGFTGVLTYYKTQLEGYLKGQKEVIKSEELKPLIEWYVEGKKRGWPIEEKPQVLFKGWGKEPNPITWQVYANCTEKRTRAGNNGIPSEFRFLSFNGYASYRVHPEARKPKKVTLMNV